MGLYRPHGKGQEWIPDPYKHMGKSKGPSLNVQINSGSNFLLNAGRQCPQTSKCYFSYHYTGKGERKREGKRGWGRKEERDRGWGEGVANHLKFKFYVFLCMLLYNKKFTKGKKLNCFFHSQR